jgi:serine/threonine-protein kinase
MTDVDPMVGRRFGSYVVEQKLGEGGMGAVYRAVQPEIGKQVAIKFLAEHLSQNPTVVQRFFAEARSVNLIQHDNIVDIFDFGQVDGFSFFVMELMKGKALEELLVERGALPIGRAVDIAIQVADAISAAHSRQIIHRDLKPDNIFLVTKSGRQDFVKLLDFGIAKLTDSGGEAQGLSRTMAGAVLGTPGYMSPEQGTGGAVDARTDIYALGVILYRMLTARLPFEGATFPEILQKQLIEPPPNLRILRTELAPPLATLVHQMIARDVAERPPSMGEVLQRLVPLMPNEYGREGSGSFRAMPHLSSNPTPSRPGPISIIPQSSTTLSGAAGQKDGEDRPAKRPMGLVIGGGAALVALVAVAFVSFGKKNPPPPPTAIQTPETPATTAPKLTVTPPAPTPTATAPVVVAPTAHVAPAGSFLAYIETDPPGAQILLGAKVLGVTPQEVVVPGDHAALTLQKAGFRDEGVEVTGPGQYRQHLHRAVVRPASPPPSRPAAVVSRPLPAAPPVPVVKPATKKPSIGLDD